MLTILKPWLHEEWQYFRKGAQWLVGFSDTWAKEVKERCEKIGFIVKEKVDKGNYYVCEVTEQTKILEIRKLINTSGVLKVSPNWMIKTADLAYKQTVEEERKIAARQAAAARGVREHHVGHPKVSWGMMDYPNGHIM